MSDNVFCTIMAGGTGTRLWPLSQPGMPKQFLDLVGIGQTMLQMTYNRFRALCRPENFVVVTLEEYKDLVRRQLPDVPEANILCEPFKRNTAACVAYANAYIRQKSDGATVIVTPSDHLILNESLFIDNVKNAVAYASTRDVLLTVGVRAHRPETAFGYIQVGDRVADSDDGINQVRTFTEKPNAEIAQVFYECGDFCWNTGVFIWTTSSADKALRTHLPNLQAAFDALDTMPVSHWTPEAVRKVYDECESVSIDYGVMEKAHNVCVSLTEALWSDLGGWDAIYEQSSKDVNQNAILSGRVMAQKSEGCLINVDKGRTCIVVGLKDYMVVQRGDITLICPRQQGPTSWKYTAELKAEGPQG